MKQAGLTQGAFSGHFSSKEELLREALDDGFYLGFHPLDLALCRAVTRCRSDLTSLSAAVARC